MKKILLLFILMTFSPVVSAQETIPDIRHIKPDYESIKTAVNDSSSKYFYSKLLQKFNNGAYMTFDEKRYLYYGSVFQESYNKDYSSNLLNDIHDITIKQKLSDEDLDNLLNYSLEILAENPFDLEAMNYATFVYRRKGLELQNQLMGIKFSIVLDAIFSSGDGITEKNALHVIHNRDKAFIPKLMGLKPTDTDFDKNYIPFETNEKDLKGFWFYTYK